jgi:hypothetical protein
MSMDKAPLFFGLVFPAFMVLAGGWAYYVGYFDAVWYLYSAVTPALVTVLGWGAVMLNEIAMKRERRREHTTMATPTLSFGHFLTSAPLEAGDLPDRNEPDRLVDTIDVVNLVLPWAGSTAKAVTWYRTHPLPDFDSQTAEQLVNQGRVEVIKAYLARTETGGFT